MLGHARSILALELLTRFVASLLKGWNETQLVSVLPHHVAHHGNSDPDIRGWRYEVREAQNVPKLLVWSSLERA